jgi:hypothetical protein
MSETKITPVKSVSKGNLSPVRIVVNSKTGAIITANTDSPEYGYYRVEQTYEVDNIYNGFSELRRVSALRKGKLDVLKKQVMEAQENNLILPGKITTQEYLEDNIPEVIKANVFNKKLSLEQNIDRYAKRAGEKGPVLTYKMKKILSFKFYDANDVLPQVTIDHDNVAEIQAWNNNKKASALTSTTSSILPQNEEFLNESAQTTEG